MFFEWSFEGLVIVWIACTAAFGVSLFQFLGMIKGQDKEETVRFGMRTFFFGALVVLSVIFLATFPVCANCGEKVNTDYCTSCGQLVEKEISPTCSECGTECDTAFCGDCGTPMNPEG